MLGAMVIQDMPSGSQDMILGSDSDSDPDEYRSAFLTPLRENQGMINNTSGATRQLHYRGIPASGENLDT